MYLSRTLYTALSMPPKRGHDDGSPAKAPSQTNTKRTRRDNSPPSPSASVATPASNDGPSTEHNDPSHSPSADDDPSLIVDYNESTPLPSPHSGDEHSAFLFTGLLVSMSWGTSSSTYLP